MGTAGTVSAETIQKYIERTEHIKGRRWMITRTVVFPIYPTKDQKRVLQETLKLYSKAWKECVDVAWDMEKLSAIDVHKKTYKMLKKSLGLKTQSLYSCSCGLTLNADLNASRNISKQWRIANGYASGLPVNQPIVAGSTGSSYKLPTSVGSS